jgi:hypothetical protein
MPELDAFGLRKGSNVSKAAALAARPDGATMGEMIDVTGDTQYNVFRRLESHGFKVRREGQGRGMRIWLSGEAQPIEDEGDSQEGTDAVTAKDKNGNVVVIELKAVKAGPDAVAQLLAYMGEVKASQNPSGTLRGILIAPDFQPKTLSAASVVPNVELKRYQFSLSLENA